MMEEQREAALQANRDVRLSWDTLLKLGLRGFQAKRTARGSYLAGTFLEFRKCSASSERIRRGVREGRAAAAKGSSQWQSRSAHVAVM